MCGGGDRIRTCVSRVKAGYLRPLDYTPLVALAEDRGIEPLSPVRSHGLANRCIAALPIFQLLET